VASGRDSLRTARSAHLTFSSAVMCANRLNRWKTMPMEARRRAVSRSWSSIRCPWATRWLIAWPSTRIAPESIDSRWLMHLSSVDFPLPEGPIRQLTSPGATAKSTSRSTSVGP